MKKVRLIAIPAFSLTSALVFPAAAFAQDSSTSGDQYSSNYSTVDVTQDSSNYNSSSGGDVTSLHAAR